MARIQVGDRRGICAGQYGGSRDSYTLVLAHVENGVAVLDLVREAKPPFDPASVTREFSDTVKSYGLREVIGDAYGGMWPVEMWATNGVHYKHSRKTTLVFGEPTLANRRTLLSRDDYATRRSSLSRRSAIKRRSCLYRNSTRLNYTHLHI